MNFKTVYQVAPTLALMGLVSCQTARTGGKLVDRSRNEIVISSPSDQRSALPEAAKDSSLTSAREKLQEAVDKDPKDQTSLVSLAQLQLAQDHFREAEDTCQKVLRLDVKNQDARKVLAQSAIRQGNYDMAMIFLTAVDGEQSRDSNVINMLALVSLSRGDSGNAMRLWKQALTLNSNDISVRMNMGVMYLKYRLLSQASAQFERILKVAPNHQDAKLHLAIINSTRGDNEKSIEVYKEILAKDKDNPLALYNLAVSQKALTQYDDALDSLKEYIKASPEKSSHTDRAFALIEEINTIKQSQGSKISDGDIQNLASELDKKKKSARVDQSTPPATTNSTTAANAAAAPAGTGPKPPQGGTTDKPVAPPQQANVKKSNPNLGADQDVDELERELNAH